MASAGTKDAFLKIVGSSQAAANWTRVWGSSTEETVAGLSVDAAGNLSVAMLATGAILGGTQAGGIALSRYRSDGTLIGHVETESEYFTPTDQSGLPNGDVWVSGFIDTPNAGWPDAYAVKLSAAGKVLGHVQLGNANSDVAAAIAAAPDGGAFVTGRIDTYLFVTRLSPTGQVVWTKKFPEGGQANGRGIVALPSGGAIVTGFMLSLPTPSFVRKLDEQGNVVWTEAAGMAGSSLDAGQRLVLAPDGTFYLAGITNGALVPNGYRGKQDFFVEQRSADGKVLWTKQYGSDDDDEVTGLALGAGALFVAGNSWGTFAGPNRGQSDGFVLRIKL